MLGGSIEYYGRYYLGGRVDMDELMHGLREIYDDLQSAQPGTNRHF